MTATCLTLLLASSSAETFSLHVITSSRDSTVETLVAKPESTDAERPWGWNKG